MKRLFSFWIYCAGIALVFISLNGCDGGESALKIDLSERVPLRLTPEAHVVTYAYLPQYAHTESYRRHRRLVQYLRKTTGLNIRQIFPDTFSQFVNMVGQGKIDIGYCNPFIYITIADRYGASAIARPIEPGGNDQFRGQIICRDDNRAIHTVADCRGKSWIAVDPVSSGGYLYPLGLFMAHGIRAEDFSEIAFAPGPGGKQEKVVLAVYSGAYDIGAIREGTLAVLAGRIDLNRIRVIASTQWYPGWVYAVRAGLDASVVQSLRQALLALSASHAADRDILEPAHIIGIVTARDQDFDSVRQLAADVGLASPQ